tara:strand:- start:119 stop:511 length:393 start_codon:yes stop_codon:yes gene_type:complete
MPALSQSLEFVVNNTSTVSVTYPNSTDTTMVYVSEKVKGDGYFGGSDGVHTVMYTATINFIGTITSQATLASDPVESDWFNIANTSVTYTEIDDRDTKTVDYYNFTGNFVWVRGRIVIDGGSVESIQYNH